MKRIKRILIRSYEKGLLFRDREFQKVLEAGTHWFVDPLNKIRVDVVSMRDPWLIHEDLDILIKAGVMRMGSTTGVRVPRRMISIWGIDLNDLSIRSRLASLIIKGSPPETTTSRISGCPAM